MFSGNFKTARQSLRNSRWRTNFTMLGIIIGITSVVTVVSLGEGLKHQVVGQVNQLGNDVLTVRPGKLLSKDGKVTDLNLYAFLAPSTLTERDVETLKHSGIVSGVTPIEFVTNSASSDSGELNDLFVAGTSGDFADTLHQKVDYGAFFSDDSEFTDTAIIGRSVANRMFGELNPVGETIRIRGQDFTVHGVLAASSGGQLSVAQADYNSSVFIPEAAAKKLTSDNTNILQIFIRLKPGVDTDTAASRLNAILIRNHGGSQDFTVLKPQQLLGVTNQVLNTVTSSVSAIAAVSLIVGGIGIMNIMFVSVTERTREIGIRKAVGATNRQILNQFLIEGLVLTISGGILGIITSLLLNLLLRLYTTWKPVVSLPLILLAVGISVAAGVIFSIIPALKAARKDPIMALRNE